MTFWIGLIGLTISGGVLLWLLFEVDRPRKDCVPRGGVPVGGYNKANGEHFTGRGQATGQVYGLRNWNIDSYFRLTGKVYKAQPWRPGPNHARCMQKRTQTEGGLLIGGHAGTLLPPGGYDADDHDMETCGGGTGHGFYAYYDGSRDYHDAGDVTGIIRGWGTVCVGDKGFRCMDAEIMAMKFSAGITPQVKARIVHLYPDVKVCQSIAEMLTLFPLTADGLEMLPEADDAFWTMEEK